MVLTAYFDDSKEGLHYAIAGYMGLLEKWDDVFSPRWQAMIQDAPHPLPVSKRIAGQGKPEFKASAVRPCNEDMKGLGWTVTEATELYKEAVGIIVDPTMAGIRGIGAAMHLPDRLTGDKHLRMERLGYSQCFSFVVYQAMKMAASLGVTDRVVFVFDKQSKLEGIARKVFDAVIEGHENQFYCSISGPHFEHSDDVVPLQAADLLAYETRREMEGATREPPRKTSAALRRLVSERWHLCAHFDATALRQLEEMQATHGPDTNVEWPTLYATGRTDLFREDPPSSEP